MDNTECHPVDDCIVRPLKGFPVDANDASKSLQLMPAYTFSPPLRQKCRLRENEVFRQYYMIPFIEVLT